MMQSKSNIFIIVLVILVIVGGGVYWFGFRDSSETTTPTTSSGLVSMNTGTVQTPATPSVAVMGDSSTGNQVVQILRNLSNIKLDDAVFRNPAFALLTDISIALPPVTIQGRRNPFGATTGAAAVTTPVPTIPTAPAVGTGTSIPVM